MAEDLGTWPPEQATVLVDALQRAGLSPRTKRTKEGIEVGVPDGESDQAHQTLVANMDAIAKAAKPTPPAGRRRGRAAAVRAHPSGEQSQRPQRPLTTQRLARMGRPIAVLVAGLLLAAVVPGALKILVVVASLALMVWLIGKDAEDDEGST